MRRLLVIIIAVFILFSCNNHKENKKKADLKKTELQSDSGFVNLFRILTNNSKYIDFELDTTYGYIKSGFLFDSLYRNAIIVSFDSANYDHSSLSILELKDNSWKIIYDQHNTEIMRPYEIKAYIEDFNFDGIKDIGILNQVSNGTTIMTFHLWLQKPNNKFIYIPEFQEIGTPVIDYNKKIIQSFWACCVFSELSLSDYFWKDNSLILSKKLNITNYCNKIEAIKEFYEYKSDSLKLTKTKKINISGGLNNIIYYYEDNWSLVKPSIIL